VSPAQPWRPSASVPTLRLRASVMAAIRAFFAERDVLEVETPALSRAGITDLQLEPVAARAHALGTAPLYLTTSPEYAMKKLLAAGTGDIFQVCRVYRDGELGRWHQPEFTLLEWYRVGWNEAELMAEVEALLNTVLQGHRPLTPTVTMSYREAFRSLLGVDAMGDPIAIGHALKARGVDVPAGIGDDSLLDLALSTAIAPQLQATGITFIYDYPQSQAALARIKPGSPPVAARFEAFFGGLELANGFDELTDEAEQRARFESELEQRRKNALPVPPIDEAFLAALSHGLPSCAGVAVGLDRLVALAAGIETVAETMSFAHSLD